MEAIKTSVTNSPAESEVKGKAVKKSGKRIGYNYIILKSLKESQKNDVVKCLYIKSLTNFGICVIKEGTYGDSKDKQGRDIKDRLMWQKELHEKLQDKVRLPRLLGSFEENGNYYLVLERIKGKSLYKACKEVGKDLREGLLTGNKLGMKFLGYMIQMIELLATLHNQGIVHRDVTATNFMITPAGKVAVIDMELSYSLEKVFPDPPFQLGTYGYMSPEQEAMAMPAKAQDTFSAAAIILQMWAGIAPGKLIPASFNELEEKVRFFIPDKNFADVIVGCLHPEPTLRPNLSYVRETILEYVNGLQKHIKRPASSCRKYSRSELIEIIQQSIGTISSPLLADAEKGWFSENTSAPRSPEKKKINKGWYASYYKGASGIIYMLSRASLVGFDVKSASPFIDKGLELVELKYINRPDAPSGSFHFGGSGISAVLATTICDGLLEPQNRYFDWIDRLLALNNQEKNFQRGISGQGIADLLCLPFLHPGKVKERLTNYVDILISEQKKDGSWFRSVNDKKNHVTKGFAHGMAGILYFLLQYSQVYQCNKTRMAAENGLGWLIKKAIRENNGLTWRSASNKEIAPGWCEGGTGIALVFLKAYSLTANPTYKEFASLALSHVGSNTIDTNLGQCHGMAGLGEIYLQAFNILQEEHWLDRSEWIVKLLMHTKKTHLTYGPYWLIDNEREPTPDFMNGNSGIIHYLLRYCYPDKLNFPLLPI